MRLQHPVSEECEWTAQASTLREVVHLTDKHGRNRSSAALSVDEAERLGRELLHEAGRIRAREAEWKALARKVTP